MKYIILLCFFISTSLYAKDEGVKVEGQDKKWLCQSVTEKGKKQFYLISKPTSSAGKYKVRGDIYVMITREGKKDVFSFVAGYNFKPKSSATISFDEGKSFKLFTDGDRAWALDDKADKEIVQLMKKSKQVTIKGTTAKNNETVDKFDLSGFIAAYARLK